MAIQLINTRITKSEYILVKHPTDNASGSISVTANFDISQPDESNKFTTATKILIRATEESDNEVIFTIDISISSLYESDIDDVNKKSYELFLPSIIFAHSHINELLNKALIGKIVIEQELLLHILYEHIKEAG
ncbi:MAG: hypothetical protein HFP78_07690 [Methylococcales symbiont of Hymedesmia sp. n. MRB-2018]|nr:MAG: hypothetical protein HFP78_07690 [Methylococcales symbiont of Hymedesmia sp. n. MRB-2018]